MLHTELDYSETLLKLVVNSQPPVAQRGMRTDAGMGREECAISVTKAITNSAPLRTVPCAVLSAHLMISLCGEKRQAGEGMHTECHEQGQGGSSLNAL